MSFHIISYQIVITSLSYHIISCSYYIIILSNHSILFHKNQNTSQESLRDAAIEKFTAPAIPLDPGHKETCEEGVHEGEEEEHMEDDEEIDTEEW